MKTSHGVLAALFLLATCSEGSRESNSSAGSGLESSRHMLGTIPASESAVWQNLGSKATPTARYLHAAALDTARQVVVVFGGVFAPYGSGTEDPPNRETWEWNTTAGTWTNRTVTKNAPAARSGAAMIFDAKRAKCTLFGGRAQSGLNYEDTWEWDPATGLWADVSKAGSHPSARSQTGMVYQASTGKILLFGGGKSDTTDGKTSADVVLSQGDTWELDPATQIWTAHKPPLSPSARHAMGLVWDTARNKAVLFGGMQVDVSGVVGIPKQDIWEWDPSTATWTERTTVGDKPAPRYGHGMAFDGGRGKVVVFGGVDMATGTTGANLADAWEWDGTTGAWNQRMTGAEVPMPNPRRYASLVSDDTRGRLVLVAGSASYDPAGGTNYVDSVGNREVWELDPSKPAFTNRTPPFDITSSPRTGHCLAYNPVTGKTYVFGGSDPLSGKLFDDLWSWDGKTWEQVPADTRPPGRSDAAMAFDPARKSLILYGGFDPIWDVEGRSDTWEWSPSAGWSELHPATNPGPLVSHGMVTDTTRGKLLLFGGAGSNGGNWLITDTTRNQVWEWDGTTLSWTNRTPTSSSHCPIGIRQPVMAYDSDRKKLFVYDGGAFDGTGGYPPKIGEYWEWDPQSGGWELFDTKDARSGILSTASAVAYDSIRRREVMLAQRFSDTSPDGSNETWELDPNSQTLYVRTVTSPPAGPMAFDSTRRVAVLFVGTDLWEYRVTSLGNGEGCTAESASSCASGFCVDGVCCEAAACTGSCKSCNVRGSEGKCVLAKAGSEVAGSCSDGQACDGSGKCKSKNGQPCTAASTCASGVCADGVCCDRACTGVCVACDQSGQAGKCTPFAAGTDPEHACGEGTGVCQAVCDGSGACAFPKSDITCDKCTGCDGAGTCSVRDPYCYVGPGTGGQPSAGGAGGVSGGTGGQPSGGAGGTATTPNGSGGSTRLGGSTGRPPDAGGGLGAGGLPQGRAGGIGGSAFGSGGAIGDGGHTSSAGGAAGARDGGVSAGGEPGRDAATDSTLPRRQSSGCSCELGRATGSHPMAPVLLSAIGLLLVRIRRKRRSVASLLRVAKSTIAWGAGRLCRLRTIARGRAKRAGRWWVGRSLGLGNPLRVSKSKTRNGAIVALLLLATCSEEVRDGQSSSSSFESARQRLGKVPPSESAVWQKLSFSATPNPRYLQSVAMDSARQVVVMFGGANYDPNSGAAIPNQETWEWNTETGRWTNRTGTGKAPAARSGAAMVYDSTRARMVLFGGRAQSGLDYEDTWEWDPATGQWTDVTNAGSHPSARSQGGMVYEAATGKILLFGGGRSDGSSFEATSVVLSHGDTWELDPATHSWTSLKPTRAPSARHDLGLVWDSIRNKAVLFGGRHIDTSKSTDTPQQDTWEWDPGAATWTERTSAGAKPGARQGHAMAFDGGRGKVVVFGGFDMAADDGLSDLWEWDPTTTAWAQRMTGSETPMPTPRWNASLVYDDARTHLELVAGASYDRSSPRQVALIGSREVWELDPSKPAFTDRTAAVDVPSARYYHCMAYYPPTGKTYVFGGLDEMAGTLNDLWAWDGKLWEQIATDKRPAARIQAALAFDPARQSLILFGGSASSYLEYATADTWEWSPTTGWIELSPRSSPDPHVEHKMATDTARNKVLLFGGYRRIGTTGDVWEWDGATSSWTDRSPTSSIGEPDQWQSLVMGYDSGQKKLFVYDGSMNNSAKIGAYWQWDPTSAGWAQYGTGDASHGGIVDTGTYDSIRRRAIILARGFESDPRYATTETWELDTNSETLYVRTVAGPPTLTGPTMAFDSARGVVVLFGGELGTGVATNETWEFRVTSLGNGEGCTAAFASSCASGFCVDGVCCEAAACTGACKSCNVRGSEGTCVLAKAGTEVPGSCTSGQACDGNGSCMSGNGQPCTTAGVCASGFCVDSVCCDSACDGTCVACNQTGQVGHCAPFAAGTDPRQQCGKGQGVCKSACNGVSGCGFPHQNVYCDGCFTCDGSGTCGMLDPFCYDITGGSPFGTGGSAAGGSGGFASGGATGSGGSLPVLGGAGGSGSFSGGAGGFSTSLGGTGGGATAGSRSDGGALGGSGGRSGGTTSIASGGSTGQTSSTGGADGKRDGGNVGDVGAEPAKVSLIRGCSCGLGRPEAKGARATWLVAFALLLASPRRRRRK